jgi:hypothetical protein
MPASLTFAPARAASARRLRARPSQARRDWMHLEAHRDCDEFLNGRGQSAVNGQPSSPVLLRYPRHGHVLYLEVGAAVRGPTCVFEDGDAVPASARGADGALAPSALGQMPVFRRLHVIPARAGRLLRFAGDAMHAVPRPFDAYLARGEPAITRGFGAEGPELRRQVLLFNLWEHGPPLELEPVAARGEGASALERAARCRDRASWRDAPRARVRPARLGIWPPAAAAAVPLLVSMLGPAYRRGYSSRVFCVRAPPAVRQALGEHETHSVVELDRATNLLLCAGRLALRLTARRRQQRQGVEPARLRSELEAAQQLGADDAGGSDRSDDDDDVSVYERPVIKGI